MEPWVTEIIKQSPYAAVLVGVLFFVFKQQAARDAAQENREKCSRQERREMLDIFQAANDKLAIQVAQQLGQIGTALTTLTAGLTSAVEKMNKDHEGIHRAHEHQRLEHAEILGRLGKAEK